MEEDIKMESGDVKGDWGKRLRLRKSTGGLSASGEADMTDNNSSRQDELSDRKISARPSPKKQRNQRATDTAKRTPTAQSKRRSSTSLRKPKTPAKVHKASRAPPTPPPPPATPSSSSTTTTTATTAHPADVSHSQASGPSSPLPSPPQPQLTENHSGADLPATTNDLPVSTNDLPVAINGVFTCARCTFDSKDIATFLQHTHNGTNGLPHNEVTKDGHTRQQGSDLHSYLSLGPPGLPIKYEPSKQSYTAKHKATMARIRKGRRYTWRRREAQAKVEEDASPELKLFLTKHPLKPNSWMARGFLSVEKEMLDENHFLLNPEKTIEATNKYLERRTIKEERSGMKFAIKDELENGSRPSTPLALPPPRNGTSSPSEAINPSNTELARLMERNNISIPPNCTTQVQGFKMVEGKKHLVLKVVPAAKQETADTAESSPSPRESITSDTKTTMREEGDSDQTGPSCSLSEVQECNGNPANGTVSLCASPLGAVADANASPPEKPAHLQSDNQGLCDEQHQGCFSLRLSLSPDRESVVANGLETTGESEQPNEPLPQPPRAIPVPAAEEESTCGLLRDADQALVEKAQTSADVVESDECLSSAAAAAAAAAAADVELLDLEDCHGGLPALPLSPSKSNSRPASPPRTQEEEKEEEGKDCSSPDDRTSINDNGECHIPESSSSSSDADANSATVEICGETETVEPPPPPHNLDCSLSLQASCSENSKTSVSVSSPDASAQLNSELRTVAPPTCTQDAVEHPGDPETSPLNAEKQEANKRLRDSSSQRTEEGAPDGPPVSKLSRTLCSQEVEGEEVVVPPALGATLHSALKDAQHSTSDASTKSALKTETRTALKDSPLTALQGATDTEMGGSPDTALGGTRPHTALKDTDTALGVHTHTELGGTTTHPSLEAAAIPMPTETPTSDHQEDSGVRHMEKTLRLFPFSYFQLVTRPEGACQPVVVLNHPDVEVPEVTDIMRVVHKYGTEVQKVRLCAGTIKALDAGHALDADGDGDGDRDGGGGVRCVPGTPSSSGTGGTPPLPLHLPPLSPSPSPSPSPGRVERRRSTVKERFLLKMKLRRSGQNAHFQVVSPERQPCLLRCWFCGRAFAKQDEFISHEQRHMLDTNGDLSGWLKSQ